MSEFTEKHIVALDLGSSKMALIVARVDEGDAQIVYYKETQSAGIINSEVSNMGHACAPLSHLIKDAEDALCIKLNHVVIGMPKFPIRQEANSGKVTDRGDYEEITQEDVDTLKRFAQETYPLQETDKEAIYGAVAQSFSDGESFQIKESDIVGMSSDILEGHFKIFIGKKRGLRNADVLLTKAGISAVKKYFTADTTAQVVLTETEMENGVALVDFGGGCTTVTIYHDGIMRHFASIPFGGRNVTQDIKSELQITERLAENIKLAYGACMPEKLQNMSEKVLHIMENSTGQIKQVPVKYLSEIITARMEEIIEAVLYEINESELAENIRCGIVITGGVAQTANLAMLINDMSGYKVRIGYPNVAISDSYVDGIHDTTAATALGLMTAALKEEMINCAVESTVADVPEPEFPDKPSSETAVSEPAVSESTITEDDERWKEVETVFEVEEEEKKAKKWKIFDVFWGKARKIGDNFNEFIDGITDSKENENEN